VELASVACCAATQREARFCLPGPALCSQGTSRHAHRVDGVKPRRLTGLDGLSDRLKFLYNCRHHKEDDYIRN